MLTRPSLRRLLVAIALPALGLGPGCDSTSAEIPLAKVPPPPADFGKAVTKRNTPKGGSPENAHELNR